MRDMSDFEKDEFLVGPYRVVERMEGSKGIVYKLLNTEPRGLFPQTYLCAKTLKSEYLRSRSEVDQFLEEARNWLSLRERPGIVTAYQYVENIRGKPYILIRYADWGSLADLIKKGFAPWRSSDECFHALKFCLVVSRALAYIHRKAHLSHGDVSLNNILLYGKEIAESKGWTSCGDPSASTALTETLNPSSSQPLSVAKHALPVLTDFGVARVYASDRSDYAGAFHDLNSFGLRVMYPLFSGEKTLRAVNIQSPSRFPGELGKELAELGAICRKGAVSSFDEVSSAFETMFRDHYQIEFPSEDSVLNKVFLPLIEMMRENFGLAADTPELQPPHRDHIKRFGCQRAVTGPGYSVVEYRSADSLIALGDSYLQLGDYQEAKRSYEEALSLSALGVVRPNHPVIEDQRRAYQGLASLYAKLNQPWLAREYLKKARDLTENEKSGGD